MKFKYLRDRLFLTCFTVYWINRLMEGLELSTELFQFYLNDVICIPFWVPMMLWALRRLGLRRHDAPPQPHEIAIPVFIWGMMFEVILPNTAGWSHVTVADPWDVVCYAAGGWLASLYWHREAIYRKNRRSTLAVIAETPSSMGRDNVQQSDPAPKTAPPLGVS